ncbi:hypothetical protein [Solirubrobacter soli]|uniref:hypothetical protein n=1 Tax=Solirubrobacter soli TaxID=363832 RepID=UPI0003F95925|nr:hypothetical protein [Solirubrobacter soli]
MKLGASITLVLVLALAAPASAATTPNSCRYSYDTLYRDMPVQLSGAAPDVASAVPGDTIHTAQGTAGVELPSYLASFGYAVGLLHEGRNDIPVKVWIAVRATNTAERVQVVGPIAVTATTVITVDPADDNRFLSAAPFAYTTPVVPALTWTAAGGDVVVSQAHAGSITTQLPVGTNGALRTVTGSAVIDAQFAGGASIYMDCRPGRTTGIEFDFAGPSYEPGPATPVATVAGPKNLMCIRPDKTLVPVRGLLHVDGAPAEFTVGTPYVLPPATLETDTAAGAWSALVAASNTAERTQFVNGDGPTTWTPTGEGPIEFRLAPPIDVASGSVLVGDGLKCVPGALSQDLAFTYNLDTPVFARAVDSAKPAPSVTPTPTPVATVAPTPTPTPTPRFKAPAGEVASTRLTSRGGKVELRIRCPSGSATCRGKITVETISKPKRALTTRASYTIAPGRQRTITLKLSQAGRDAVKRQRSVKVRVTIATGAGVTATRRVTLQRRGS